jgi:hypothetical protein
VAPEEIAEDEKTIAKEYRQGRDIELAWTTTRLLPH